MIPEPTSSTAPMATSPKMKVKGCSLYQIHKILFVLLPPDGSAETADIPSHCSYSKTIVAAFAEAKEKARLRICCRRGQSANGTLLSIQFQLQLATPSHRNSASRISCLAAYLCNPRTGVRHGCQNALGNPRSQELDGRAESLCSQSHAT